MSSPTRSPFTGHSVAVDAGPAGAWFWLALGLALWCETAGSALGKRSPEWVSPPQARCSDGRLCVPLWPCCPGAVRCGEGLRGALGGRVGRGRSRPETETAIRHFRDYVLGPEWTRGRKPLANKGVPAPKGLPEMRRGRKCCNPASHRSRKPAACQRQGMGGSGPARAQKGPRLSGGRAVGTGVGGSPGRSPVSSPT